jgi:hypothetical protein
MKTRDALTKNAERRIARSICVFSSDYGELSTEEWIDILLSIARTMNKTNKLTRCALAGQLLKEKEKGKRKRNKPYVAQGN